MSLTIRSVEATLVLVPMRRPLGTSAARVTAAPLLLLDLHTEEGVTGRAYSFCYLESAGHASLPLVREVHEALAGTPADPASARAVLEARFKLLGVRGLVAAVVSLVDTACWDALALAAGLPLARLLGAPLRPIPAYNSNGLGLIEASAAADEAQELVAEGFRAVKLRLGRAPEDDLAAVRAVRAAVGPDVEVMADYNQALSLPDALVRCRLLDDEGLSWIEEPVRHDDYAANAQLTAALRTPVQIGENFAGPRAMALALAHDASDLVMPDLDRIGGVTGWRDAAALANARGVPLSSHLFPEVSVHLLAATPTAHWLEYVDWAAPILREPLRIADGHATPPDRPGNGLDWDPEAVARYRVG
ncbi:enolase C-terminal domain-like protein [Amycolatopsis rhabdoformis]|uniref:Enolase C-terminal domain-like protein n=1 Tax=Amycolatopsis rhabdoformis TaxID=1448059 RepID=A0ABZ1HVK2_9PSEU|nr:enolase C-terminal domain-like protein [Amycolatopsis rhabdoformis]WSE26322.1 enolase C-terminal domain-like protein [Amycolatopsis rhabdoformis]